MKEEEEREENKDVKTIAAVTKKEGRIVVSVEAEAAVAEFTDAVNDGFDAGRANRYEVASYMILWFKNHGPDDAISEIRRRSANGFSMLDAVLKKYKGFGELPSDIQSALDKHFFGEAAKEQKKAKKNLKQECITDTLIESDAA